MTADNAACQHVEPPETHRDEAAAERAVGGVEVPAAEPAGRSERHAVSPACHQRGAGDPGSCGTRPPIRPLAHWGACDPPGSRARVPGGRRGGGIVVHPSQVLSSIVVPPASRAVDQLGAHASAVVARTGDATPDVAGVSPAAADERGCLASARSLQSCLYPRLPLERQYARPGERSRCRPPQASGGERAQDASRTSRQRSDRNAARISVAKSSGSSQAAKWPPLSTSLK